MVVAGGSAGQGSELDRRGSGEAGRRQRRDDSRCRPVRARPDESLVRAECPAAFRKADIVGVVSGTPQTGKSGWECAACGSVMTSAEGVCHGCGRRRGAAAKAPAQPPVEQCRLRRWDGYVMSTFYAATPEGAVVAESRPFRRRRAEAGDRTEQAQQAYEDLVAALRAEGWEQVAHVSNEPFEGHFSRPSPLAASHPPPQRVRVVTSPPPPEPPSSSTGAPAPPPVTIPPETSPDPATAPGDSDGPPDRSTRSARARGGKPEPDSPKERKPAGAKPKRPTKSARSGGKKAKRRGVKKQGTAGSTERPGQPVRERSPSPTPPVVRGEEPGERPPAAQPVRLRPTRRETAFDARLRISEPDELVVSASDPFTYLWTNADESHGHHLEAVARLRESKQLPTEEDPTAEEPALEEHRPWWRPGGRWAPRRFGV